MSKGNTKQNNHKSCTTSLVKVMKITKSTKTQAKYNETTAKLGKQIATVKDLKDKYKTEKKEVIAAS